MPFTDGNVYPSEESLEPCPSEAKTSKEGHRRGCSVKVPFVRAELTCSSHCSVPSSGSSAEISWIPLLSVPENVLAGMEHGVGHRFEDMAISLVDRNKGDSSCWNSVWDESDEVQCTITHLTSGRSSSPNGQMDGANSGVIFVKPVRQRHYIVLSNKIAQGSYSQRTFVNAAHPRSR
jgi:hypothetical protein